MPTQKSEVRTQSPERGGRQQAIEDARLFLLGRRVFDVAMGRYMIGKRDKPPSWKVFVERFRERGVDAG